MEVAVEFGGDVVFKTRFQAHVPDQIGEVFLGEISALPRLQTFHLHLQTVPLRQPFGQQIAHLFFQFGQIVTAVRLRLGHLFHHPGTFVLFQPGHLLFDFRQTPFDARHFAQQRFRQLLICPAVIELVIGFGRFGQFMQLIQIAGRIGRIDRHHQLGAIITVAFVNGRVRVKTACQLPVQLLHLRPCIFILLWAGAGRRFPITVLSIFGGAVPARPGSGIVGRFRIPPLAKPAQLPPQFPNFLVQRAQLARQRAETRPQPELKSVNDRVTFRQFRFGVYQLGHQFFQFGPQVGHLCLPIIGCGRQLLRKHARIVAKSAGRAEKWGERRNGRYPTRSTSQL